jgi:hypothetical protein
MRTSLIRDAALGSLPTPGSYSADGRGSGSRGSSEVRGPESTSPEAWPRVRPRGASAGSVLTSMNARASCGASTARPSSPAVCATKVRAFVPGARTWWFAPGSLETAISANCLLVYRNPVPRNTLPRIFSEEYQRNTSGFSLRCTTAPSPSWQA